MNKGIRSIQTKFQAQIPIVGLETLEENQSLLEIAKMGLRYRTNTGKRHTIMRWSLGTGKLNKITVRDEEVYREEAEEYISEGDPILSILTHVEKSKDGYIYVLTDINKYINNYPEAIAQIKEMLFTLSQKEVKIIILSNKIKLPNDLVRLVPIVKFDPPTVENIAKLINNYLNEIICELSSQRKIDNQITNYENVARACQGLGLEEITCFLREHIIELTINSGDSTVIEEDLMVKKLIQHKTEILERLGLKVYNTEDVIPIGGMQNLKEWLTKRKILYHQKAESLNLEKPKGILLGGVPGCGKSLVAKNCGKVLGLPTIFLNLGSLLGSHVGESEGNVEAALQAVNDAAPCVLWIDEIEKAMSGQEDSTGVNSRILGIFLTWMQEQKSVFCVVTANNVWKLPAELTRKGRFDENFFIDLPNLEERKEILTIHLQKTGANLTEIDLEEIARKTEDFSGAEIAEGVKEAMLDSFFSKDEIDITTEQLEKIFAGAIPLAKSQPDKIQAMRTWQAKPASQSSVSSTSQRNTVKLINLN